jgi:hypothetical protein
MKSEEILKLRPRFKFGDNIMTDYFIIESGSSFFCIRSGLRNADGETKSPYHYEDCIGGENSKERALEKFNIWWNLINNK